MTAETDPAFEALLTFLKDERGFDFTGYKRASLVRRVQRRMEEVGIEGFEQFHDHLLLHPDEFTPLFNTILINVTSFFRDPETWAYLRQQVLPDLLSKREGEPIRAWSAGCATGEEAYTIAIVLAETLGLEDFTSRVKIYATDVDEDALAIARQASYGDKELENVPEDLREKYFERVGNRHVFRKELRRAVIFGRNDLVQDAPISHVDLLSCRNTLMYFNAETQSQIVQRLHFALRPGGVLVLGKAEMLLSHTGLFRPMEIKRRIFTKVHPGGREARLNLVHQGGEATFESDGEAGRLRQAALMSSPAAQVVLDASRRLAMSTSRAAHLFGIGNRDIGRPIQDLELSYRPIELRSHIDEAVAERRQVWVRDVTWVRGGADPMTFDIHVVPLSDEIGDLVGISITFNDVTHYRQLQQELEYANRQLETAYEELQSTNEELETTNEELQSTVEELETTNEELQSTNEELETMNEELQSMNDELQVSSESHREQQEVYYERNRFMTSVLSSMNAGVAVVDPDLNVIAWNARAEDLWGVRANEAEGRPLLSLDIGIELEGLRPYLGRQLKSEVGGAEVLRLTGVNRRGKPIEVQLTVSRLQADGDQPDGALIVMDVVSA